MPELPQPTKIKRKDVRNTTGVIGVARVKERTRSGKLLVRYVASLPEHNGKRGKATFSVGLYGEKEAFQAHCCRSSRGTVKARRYTLNLLTFACCALNVFARGSSVV